MLISIRYMKIQLDIPKDLNKQLKIEKVKREYSNIKEVVIKILFEHFKKSKRKK